jgi:hypothetical protein
MLKNTTKALDGAKKNNSVGELLGLTMSFNSKNQQKDLENLKVIIDCVTSLYKSQKEDKLNVLTEKTLNIGNLDFNGFTNPSGSIFVSGPYFCANNNFEQP